MDGIPVKISEKYKPPRKIILPGCILNRINSGIKIEPYGFSLERSVLEQLAYLKEAKRKHAEKRQLKRDDWLLKVKIKEPPDNESCPLDTSSQVTPESTMLTPVPISSDCRIEPARQEGQINLSDFENDTSSPFDNVELKTINEMEELAHVLGGTSIKSSSLQHSMKNQPLSNNVHLPNGYTSHQWNTTAGSYSYPGVYDNSGNNVAMTAITLPSPLISAGPHSYMHSTNDSSLYSCNTVYTGTTPHHMSHSYLSQNNSTAIRHDNYTTNSSYIPSTYQQHLRDNINTTHLLPQLPPHSPSYNVTSNTPTSHTYATTTSHNSVPSLQHHSYIPSPSNNSVVNTSHLPSSSVIVNQDSSVTSRISPSPQKKDDSGVEKILDELRRQLLLRKHEIQPRPTVPASSDLPKLYKPSVGNMNVNDSNIVNPLSNLSLQHQEFAKNMAEMGFPLPRVARATSKFGNDEAKVIEFLLQVQSLEEKRYPEEQIEKALFLHNFKEDEAISYLENLNQIMKLGFKEEDVEKALSKSSNNRDKALDILIS